MKDPFFWIILAAVVSGLLCSGLTLLICCVRKARIERRTWDQARIFYTRRAASHIIH